MQNDDQVNSSDFLDMAAFYLAVASVDRVLSVMGEGSETPSGVDVPRLEAHRKSADTLLRRFAPSVDAGIDSLLRDAAEKAKLRVKTQLNASIKGAAFQNYQRRAEFLEFFLPRLRTHANVLKDVFNEKAAQATRIAQTAEVEAPIPRLFKLGGLRVASGGMTILKRWTMEATSICGNPVSEIEEVAVDVVSTDTILDRVSQNNRRLVSLDPTDPAAVAVEQENAELLEKVNRVAEKSKDPASVKAHAAAKLATMGEKGNFATKISAHLDATPEQEEALLVRGKSVIAAGAGSGKTRVLAGKVVHHLQDLGLKMSNVMAMSFTGDSADELQERIEKYAGEIGFQIPPSSNRDAYAGIGTTHSIGLKIVAKARGGYPKLFPSFELSNLMKVAMAQVKMLPMGGGTIVPPREAMTFFPNPPPGGLAKKEDSPAMGTSSPVQNPVMENSPLMEYFQDPSRFKSIMGAAIDTINDFLSMLPKVKVSKTSKTGIYANVVDITGPGISQFWDALSDPGFKIDGRRVEFKDANPQWRQPDRFVAFSSMPFDEASVIAQIKAVTGLDKAENALQALQQFSLSDPSTLTDNEKSILVGILSRPSMQKGLARRNLSVSRTATKAASLGEGGLEKAINVKLNKIRENSPYGHLLDEPANQWFNIGATDDDFQVEDARTGEKKPIPPADFTRFVGFNKNSLKAPGEIFVESQNEGGAEMGIGDDDEGLAISNRSKRVFAAVYGAYEWLKRNAAGMGEMIEFDDMLVLSTRALIENPALLADYQKQYKCILVDEAQDLNVAQHMFIGLVAGYLDPATLKPRADGKMSADTFCFIGDDKQAIYGFRAAAPERFIEKSDLFKGANEGFKTKLLDTNFRSGSAIVNAANQLIDHNTGQIPMVCKTVPNNGEGLIQRLSVMDQEDAADRMTDLILEDLEIVRETGKPGKFYSNYGLAVRTNKELYEYAMKMIEKGIPFRSKKNFLGGPVGGIIGLFAATQTTNLSARNAGVLAGLRTPNFGMNPDKLEEKMKALGVTDYYDFLVNQDGAEKIWPRFEKMSKPLQAYADYLEEVFEIRDNPAASIIDFIVKKENPDGLTLEATLSEELLDDKEEMEAIQEEADKTDGRITPELLAQFALAPIQPLLKAAIRFPKSGDFANYVISLLESNKPNVPKKWKKGEQAHPPAAPKDRPDAVQLGTIHGWKGLEVESLYVPMWDGGFPHARSQGNTKLMEEERRLAYVAITRGRQKVTVLEPKEVNGEMVAPSQFVGEACIPLTGTALVGQIQPKPELGDEEAATREASYREYLKSAKVADFMFPSLRTEQEMGTSTDDLESLWGNLSIPTEEEN